MRTVRLVWKTVVDRDNELHVETEVIVEDDDAEEAGREAMRFVRRFLAGIGDGADS